MRRLALTLVLFGVVAVCVLLILGRGRARISPEPPDERSWLERDEPSATLSSTSERPVEPPAQVLPLRAAGVAENATRELPQRLFGSLFLTDGQGREHPGENGRFTLMLWSGESAKGFAVEVEKGAWSAELAPAGRSFDSYSAQGFEFGNRDAKGERAPEERLPIPADRRIALRARFAMELVLHVQAEESGAELDRAFVLDEDREDHALPHPGWVERLPRAKPCPLVLAAPDEDSRAVYVGAPGRAWKRVEILAESGERVVQLAPGGDLHVTVRGDAEAMLRTVLRISNADAAQRGLLAQFPLETTGERLVRGLPLGTYDVTAQLGERDSPAIGRVRADVLAGATAETLLVLDRVEAPTWVALEGELRLRRLGTSTTSSS